MIAGILLAAGRSQRFSQTGEKKQLAQLPNSQTLLESSARNLCAAVERVVIVVSDDDALISHANQIAQTLNCEVVINSQANDGMATSIQCGIRHLHDATGWLIALADMPFIKPASINAIAAQLTTHAQIIVPTYNGLRGHPVGFGAAYKAPLCQLTGDIGARDLIKRYQSNVMLLPMVDAGIVRDIDVIDEMPNV